jgi:hypothetical protein
MISWVKQSDDFFSIQFGEEWEGAEVDFTQVLNDLGDDLIKKGLAVAYFGEKKTKNWCE